jgi:hypothetical protein
MSKNPAELYASTHTLCRKASHIVFGRVFVCGCVVGGVVGGDLALIIGGAGKLLVSLTLHTLYGTGGVCVGGECLDGFPEGLGPPIVG